MKKFIFGVMLLVSLLGIVGCSNPSNSDGSEPPVIYTIINGFNETVSISYNSISLGDFTNPVDVNPGDSFKFQESDAKITNLSGKDEVQIHVTLEGIVYTGVPAISALKTGAKTISAVNGNVVY